MQWPIFIIYTLLVWLIFDKWRIMRLSPGFMRDFRARSRARYSLRINFFSCSSFKLYFGNCARVSMGYEYTK